MSKNALIAGCAGLGAAVALLVSRPAPDATAAGTVRAAGKGAKMIEKVVKSDDEWRKILTPIQYQVMPGSGIADTLVPSSCAFTNRS